MLLSKIKQTFKKCLASQVGWKMSALLRSRGVIALTYHRINANSNFFPGMPVDQFRSQMDWLRKHCTPIWPEDIFDAARKANRIRPPVIVTFDDGYRDYHDRAYPILHDMRIPAVMFLSTDFMDRGGLLWTEALHWAVMTTSESDVRVPWRPEDSTSLLTTDARKAFITGCKRHLKGIPDDERKSWMTMLFQNLNVSEPTIELDRQMLTWDEVRAMREGTRFGGHSHTHPILSQLKPESMEHEILTCRDRIAEETGVPPHCFAYPNGRACDFNETTKVLLQRHGFNIAFSTNEGIIKKDSDPLALSRQPSGGSSIGDFAALVGRA